MVSFFCIYLTVFSTIFGICVGEYYNDDDESLGKTLENPTDEYYGDDFGEDADERGQIDEKCRMVCVPKNLCVNDQVVVNGAGLIKPRTGIVSMGNDLQCGDEVACCLKNGPDDADEDNENVSNEMECGIRYDKGNEMVMNRIANGHTTRPGEYPWTIAVGLRRRDYFEYRGGGSLIHPRVVLTAAHILDNKTARYFRVRAGEWDLMKHTNEKYEHQDRNVAVIIKHSKFDVTSLINDIALLIVKEAFQLTPSINTICLPIANFAPKHSTQCSVSGWGKSGSDGKYHSILRKVELPFVERRACERQLRRTQLGKYYRLDQSLACAGGKIGSDACHGDGGSALICGTSRFYQMGIVAGGKLNYLVIQLEIIL